jgi:hypothetical protein
VSTWVKARGGTRGRLYALAQTKQRKQEIRALQAALEASERGSYAPRISRTSEMMARSRRDSDVPVEDRLALKGLQYEVKPLPFPAILCHLPNHYSPSLSPRTSNDGSGGRRSRWSARGSCT